MSRLKFMAAGVAGVLGSAMLAAVGSSPAMASQHITLVFGGWGTPQQIQAYQSEAAAFEKLHPNVTIQGEYLPWNGYETKLTAQLAAHQLPDVMVTSTAWFSEFASKGAYLNMTPYFKQSHLSANDFVPGGIAGNSIHGHLYMLPNGGAYTIGDVVVLYNKTMFKKAHLSAPPRNWTLSDFVHDAQKLTLDANGKNALEKGFNPNNTVQWGTDIGDSSNDAVWDELLPAFGGWYYNTQETHATINTPAFADAASWLKDLVTKWHASMPPAAQTGIADPFAAGKVAMIYAWDNQAQTETGLVNFPVGVAPLPVGPHGRGFFKVPNGAAAPANGWTIAANTKYPKIAWEFVKFLATSPIALKARGINGVEGLAYAPLTSTWLKMLPPKARQIELIDHWQYQTAPTKLMVPPGGNMYTEFWNDMTAQLSLYDLGKISLHQTLTTLQKDTQTLLQQQNNS
ncbi:MAG: sugar ABC transporter substrate-binding protein [Firmicutes bacterium]|nr:sugar ABC transporter substrate-binding protein [Bacillota bacterium]